MSRTFERQVNELHIRAILNRFTELGRPQICRGMLPGWLGEVCPEIDLCNNAATVRTQKALGFAIHVLGAFFFGKLLIQHVHHSHLRIRYQYGSKRVLPLFASSHHTFHAGLSTAVTVSAASHPQEFQARSTHLSPLLNSHSSSRRSGLDNTFIKRQARPAALRI